MLSSDRYHPLPKDTQVGCYKVDSVFAMHNDHTTYLAYDHTLYRNVLLREHTPRGMITRELNTLDICIIPSERETYNRAQEQFLETARRLSSFSHRSLERTFEVLQANNTHYLVNTYVIGMPLMEYMQLYPEVRHNEESFLFLLEHLFSGIRHAHKQGVNHNRLSPENIRIAAETAIPLIIGFDPLRSDFTHDPHQHRYLPESLKNGIEKPSPATDLYSLACILYHVLTGFAPEQGTHYQSLSLDTKYNKHFHSPLLTSIDNIICSHSTQRFQSIEDWITYINKIPNKVKAMPMAHPKETDDTIAISQRITKQNNPDEELKQKQTPQQKTGSHNIHHKRKKENSLQALWRWLNT